MTNPLTLPAGRELDRLIAERLGWTHISEHPILIDVWIGKHPKETGHAWNPVLIPHYSTDLNMATELLSGVSTVILIRPDSGIGSGKWQADLDGHIRFADTLTLAICRAWLSWKDGNK